MTFTTSFHDCPACEGAGVRTYGIRWEGGNGGELLTRTCDDCDGEGRIEAACYCCHRVVALDGDGCCGDCQAVPARAEIWL